MAVYVLAGWTLFTWVTRIRNAAQDHDALTTYILPVVLIVIAVAAVVRAKRWGSLLVIAATLAWLVRVPAILIGDYSIAFKVVHTGLAIVTWALAAWTVRSQARARRPATV